jgi:neutral ceramidase
VLAGFCVSRHSIVDHKVMKSARFVSVILCLGFFASVSSADEDGSVPFRAGAATANITPLMGVPLDGTIMQIGPAKHVHDELHARCLVLDDGVTRLAFAIVDNTMISAEVIDRAKRLIEEHTAIPPDHVMVAATHTHSTPRAVVGLKPDSAAHVAYLDYLSERIAEGVRRACNQLAPARIGWGRADDPRHVFNRRWRLKEGVVQANPFGELGETITMNPNREKVSNPAGPVDPEVFVLAVEHADGRPMALLANYGLHYVGGVPGGTVSADYFGAFADNIQQRLGADRQDPPFVGMMSNGTSGDVNANDFSKARQKFAPYQRIKLVADDIAATAQAVYEGLEWFDHPELGAALSKLELGLRKPDAERLEWARNTAVPKDSKLRLTRPQVYAREALALKEFPEAVEIPLQVLRIGELMIGAIPNEVFAETGLAIKAGSPAPGNTFVIELANAYHGYLPTPEQHVGGGYETWPARSSYLEVEAEAKIRARVLEMLSEMKEP